ncbi:methyltransferase domain-containing protein [Paenibacillus chitinolyticus]|uniref:Class I SAM-dependent methyltransferase n=1 Tax=Paenibacillus chitinolyticus TaxID=79263 RepID=A0A410X364_9BACL|nr:class I SAM-dependent methyltransferase [Paenibacillus chitinolyticus]MCY9588892.1 class I SAM-dependent methyltransferase [Paenibacillus chitinolyticus]MCY9597745.1 class I SAM-dependent methyltransferase [Paenibacillus chitinolyticus]QAV21045.1 methyltransferase domain-containing protein [Paenibacillus chitinolyticus]
MLTSLKAIEEYRRGAEPPVPAYTWLRFLVSAEERIVNLERIRSIHELADANPVLDYVERTLRILDGLKLSFWVKEILETVLVWSETAKGGTVRQRMQWQADGVNLFVHNIGSAQLFDRFNEMGETGTDKLLVIRTLIETHGLLGQYIRGEVPFEGNEPLTEIVKRGLLTPEELQSLLIPLNHCIIGAVSPELWSTVRSEVEELTAHISSGEQPGVWSVRERLRKLRSGSIRQGENFEAEYEKVAEALEATERVRVDKAGEGMPQGGQVFVGEALDGGTRQARQPARTKQAEHISQAGYSGLALERALQPLAGKTLWYVESALQEFSLEEVVKVFMLALQTGATTDSAMTMTDEPVHHISFERLMNAMYYDYKGVKKINVYKKRIIEKFLRELAFEHIGSSGAPVNPHLAYKVERSPSAADTVFFTFEFSAAAEKLIEFCMEAEKSPLYEKAVLLLFDLFELRRDAYDRFHNEEEYLETMNRTADYKSVMLEFITGEKVLDIGPGGGVMLDLIEQRLPDKQPVGIDISTNVIEALNRKKQLEGHRWEVLKGDALNLKDYVHPGTVGTVIFSSILHELYSYIEWNGSRFNLDTVAAALRSAFDVLAAGGRIIIRDGIMTEPAEMKRRIRFLAHEDKEWLLRYTGDFAGRQIQVEYAENGDAVMPVNDAMEFLYTYTWGEEAYVHEVQEQFGYFTPSGYADFIGKVLGPEAVIVEFRHFLQEGYTDALAGKVVFMDEKGAPVPLPDSTCLIVIEKRGETHLDN